MSRYDLYIENNIDPTDKECSLALIRFPAMRSQFSNPPDLVQLSVKPKNMKFKLEISLDTRSSSYDPVQAQILGGKSVPKTFSDSMVNKNFYTSSKTQVEDGQLFVGKIVNNKIICRPISNILTMRSDFTHLDLKDEVDPKEEVRPVSVKFAAPERQNIPTKNSNAQSTSEDNSDDYVPLELKNLLSRESTIQRLTLFGKQEPKVKVDPDADVKEQKPFMELGPDVKPKIEKLDVDDIYSGECSLQNSPKKSNIVKQIVKECLMKAKVVSFEEVYRFLKDHSKLPSTAQLCNKDILDALVQNAVLVQGNWSVKSEILYGDSSVRDATEVTGISIKLFTAARDYLLWLFNQDRLVNRLEYTRQVRLPDYDVLELFNQLSIFRKDIKKWEFKLPRDDRFIEKFPDIVQRQITFWKVLKANNLSIFLN